MTTTNFFEMNLVPRDKADDPGNDQLPLSLHHSAVPVRDMEVTRAFMENILQMPMVACWTEATVMPESNRAIPYCHTFFALADGSNVAYFQFADAEYAEKVFLKVGPEINRFYHLLPRTDGGGNAREFALPQKAPNGGLLRDQGKNLERSDWLAGDAVDIEPVSAPNSL